MIQLRTAPGAALDFDSVLDRFETAWQGEAAPAVEQFVPAGKGDAAGRRALLIELVRVDLDHRWRRAAQATKPGREEPSNLPLLPRRPKLEDYVKRLPELGPLDQLPADLIGEEYCARHCWGDRPKQEEYFQRFSRLAAQLKPVLADMDAELAHEVPKAATVRTGPKPLSGVDAFLDMLREKPLLNPWQLDQLVMEHLRRPFSDPRALARSLLERNWLTPYQVNQILLGQGQELILGQYVLLERLGEGLRGKVYKAWHVRLKRMATLKVIKKELLDEEDAVRRFYHEMQAVSQLSHPHVVHAYDAGPIEQTHFLAMEYVEGIDLAKWMKQSGPLPIGLACEYARQVALGLQHAHEHGLVHRDIKPANLLLTASSDGGPGVVKILDMGLARLRKKPKRTADGSGTLTQEGTVMGTPDFLSPEQAMDPRTADIRTDLYSLGCTLYYLLTGMVPFPGGTLLQKVEKHRKATPTAVEKLRPEVPRFVGDLVRRLMAKRPEDRYRTPAELAAALAPIVSRFGPLVSPLRSLPSAPASPAGHALRPDFGVSDLRRSRSRRLRWLFAAAATFGLIFTAGVGVAMLGSKSRTIPTATTTRPGGFVRLVEAHVPWQDMHIDLRAGDMVTFRSTGKWRMSGALPECAADGLANAPNERNLVPDWSAMCLVARIDGEDIPIPLGSHKTVRIKHAGRLFLQANAIDLASCSGSLKVEIQGGVKSDREVPGWQFGYGEFDGGVKYFHPLRYFVGQGWQGGLKLPDPHTGWVWFQGDMGRPGDLQHSAIRRWIVPHDCIVTITGTLSHHMDVGDGVAGRIVVKRLGEVGNWVVQNSTLETNVAGLELKQGDVVDVIVDCRTNPLQDIFTWRPVLFQVERTSK